MYFLSYFSSGPFFLFTSVYVPEVCFFHSCIEHQLRLLHRLRSELLYDLSFPVTFLMNFLHIAYQQKIHFVLYYVNILVIFRIRRVSISLTERKNCSFPARLREFFLNLGSKGLNATKYCDCVLLKVLYSETKDL